MRTHWCSIKLVVAACLRRQSAESVERWAAFRAATTFQQTAALCFVLVLLVVIGNERFCTSDKRRFPQHTTRRCTRVLIDLGCKACLAKCPPCDIWFVLPYFASCIVWSLVGRHRVRLRGCMPGTKATIWWRVVRIICSLPLVSHAPLKPNIIIMNYPWWNRLSFKLTGFFIRRLAWRLGQTKS